MQPPLESCPPFAPERAFVVQFWAGDSRGRRTPGWPGGACGLEAGRPVRVPGCPGGVYDHGPAGERGAHATLWMNAGAACRLRGGPLGDADRALLSDGVCHEER
jgi:hypothetical protein